VTLSRDSVYSLLAWLKRHKAAKSPRALRFELVPGHAPKIVMEPWEQAVILQGPVYDGPPGAPTRVWGRQRLLVLARLLPLVERVDVYLLGTGLPSFWVAHMGEMRLTLGLSGWTANDWTSGSNLELLSGVGEADARVVSAVGAEMQRVRRASLAGIAAAVSADERSVVAALHLLAKRGQLVYDFGEDVYRFRQVMPFELSEAVLGPESPELAGAKSISPGDVTIERMETLTAGRTLYVAKVGGTSCELILDADGKMSRAKCTCKFFFKYKLRSGPCRHLLAVKMKTSRESQSDSSFLRALSIRM